MSHAHVAVPRVPCRDWSPALLELGAVLTTFDSSEDCMSQIRDAECLLSEANFRDAFSPVLYASFTQWWEGGKAFWNVTYWMENHWVLLSRTLLFNWNFQITIFNSTPVDKRHVFKPRQTFNWASLELQFVFKVCWQKNILFLFKLWSWVSKCTPKWCSWACCVVCFIVFFSLREQFWLHIPTPYSPFSFAASAVRAGICSPELGRPREGEVGYLQPGLVQLRQDSVRTACRATRGPGWTVAGLCVCPEPLGWACTGVVKTLQHRRATWLHLPSSLLWHLAFLHLTPWKGRGKVAVLLSMGLSLQRAAESRLLVAWSFFYLLHSCALLFAGPRVRVVPRRELLEPLHTTLRERCQLPELHVHAACCPAKCSFYRNVF